MPNLVGIGNSQVPTNAMLGGLAYQDSVGEINLDKIKARTSDTATDIFVYDTSKDSDGGAWRHRTQNTSWYNEGVSATRGARKEFPAVAVIVTAYENLTIYDGDDPNLPMWMDFDYGSSGLASITMLYANGKAVSALNGIVCSVGETGWHDGLTAIDFISDTAKWRNNSYIANWTNGIGNRNVAGGYGSFITAPNEIIVNGGVNDVAMTVLPNAPINDSTGLPIPTIALATDGGVSVIKDNGTVIDLNDALGSTRPVRNVIIRGDDILYYNVNNGTIQMFFNAFSLTADSTDDVKYNYTESGGHPTCENVSALLRNSGDGPFKLATINPKSFAAAAQSGMSIFVDGVDRSISTNSASIFDSRVAYITSNYNTGYIFGDIKGAFLSDTDDTNATEVVNNHNFNGGITGWTVDLAGASGGSPGITVVSNKLRFQQGSSNSVWLTAYQDITTVVGKKYLLNIDIASTNTSANWRIYAPSSSKILGYPSYLNQGQHSATFTATSTTTRIRIQQGGSSNTVGEVNSVSVKLVDDDRSVNDHYLRVIGTIEKHPVASGADLVGYRPDSSSQGTNYLQLPLTSSIFDLTGDWSITFWAKNNGNTAQNYSGFEISPDDISSNNQYSLIPLSMYIQNDGYVGLRGMSGTANQDTGYYPLGNVGEWRCFTIVQRSGTTYLYIDGELNTSKSVTYTNPASAYSLYIFRWTYSTTRHDGRRHIDFSLFRMSETAPTEEQVKKMYYDERCLFHENAKCTLHGTSDDVKAIAYDDTNDILHVGTSAGRSKFQGLTRINNTTTAVTTAISASNEFVAEQ